MKTHEGPNSFRAPEDFRDLHLAVASSPPGSPMSAQLKAFLASHPSVAKANATLGTPASFAEEQYFGVDAFVFTSKSGKKQAFRYIIAPEKVVHLSKEEAAKKSPDYLMNDLPARLAKGPVTFHIKAQLAAAGDPTRDATQAWPDDRKVVDLGVLTIERTVADSAAALSLDARLQRRGIARVTIGRLALDTPEDQETGTDDV